MTFAARRYCDTIFPAYRFVPGRDPHPTSDTRGHSYHPPGTPVPSVTYVPPGEWKTSTDYLFGCDLYNHAYWWEAHEAWEGLWQLTDKKAVQGRFLQGLIQASACHLKRFLGGVPGVERLSRTSLTYLHGVIDELNGELNGEPFMGLDLVAFVAQLEAYYATFDARSEMKDNHDPSRYPYVCLCSA